MPNEFIVKNGLIVGGNVVTSGTITINGALAATQSWVTSQGYLTSASLSGYATQSYVTSAISALVDAAPAALDTLNELAAALGDDANFSTTITTSIGNKVSKSGDTMTGNLSFGATSNLGLTWGLNTDAAFIKFVSTGNQAGGSYLEIGTQDDLDEEIKFTQSGSLRFYLATDGFLKNASGYKYVFENGTWGINITGNANYATTAGSANTANTATTAGALTSMNISQFTNNSGYVAYGNYSWTSPVFGQYGIKSNLIDNVLYSAADRFEVFKDGVAWNTNTPFNLNYDSTADVIPVNTSRTYSIVLNTKGNPSYGIVYTEGYLYLSFYYVQIPASVSGRVRRQNGTWENISGWTNVANNASYAVWRGTVPGGNWMVEIEITINANSSVATWFSQWEYVMGRPGQYELGIINKAQDNSLWRNMYFRDSSNNVQVSIGASGLSTSQNLNISGTSALTFGSYGGGFYMQDSSWIRTVNYKSIWTQTGLLGTDGGLTVGYGGATPPSGGAIISGNVGIGTTSPTQKLHIEGGKAFVRTSNAGWGQFAVVNPVDSEVTLTWAAEGTGYPGADSTYTRQWIAGLSPFGTGTDRWSLTNKTLGGNTAITVLVGGNVGIGTTSPASKLQVVGDIRIQNETGLITDYGPLVGRYNTSQVYVGTGGSYSVVKIGRADGGALNVLSGGNVGIGTDSPNYKLHVAGNSKVDGQTLMTSGFSTYTTDGLFSADALWSGVITPSGAYRVRFGYLDQGGGQYWGRIGFVANTNWSLGTSQGGTSFSIGMGNGNNEFLINNAGKVSIGTSDTNSDKSDFTVYTGSGASLALTDDQVRMGGADVNWGVALRSYGALQTYGQALTLNTQAGNYAVNVQPNGTTVAQFYQDYSYFPGLDFSISRVNAAHASNYFRGDASHFVIGTSGTLYLNYGGNTTIITGNTTVSGGLGVSGIVSAGARKLSMGILDLNTSGTPAQFKIKTNIPWNYGGSDFTVNIKGFRYGVSQMVSLSIGWHFYADQFYSRNAISNGAWAPTITLAKSPDGYVIIHIPGPDYWAKLYVESVYSSNSADSYTSGWSWTDADLSDCTLIQTVPYKDLATSITGNSGTTSQTNFSSLTINSAAVATQAWVGSQGYLTSVSDVWVNTTGDTMTGSLTFASTADNVRIQKNGSFLNLRDPYNNIHLYNTGDGTYIDANVHFWRSQAGTHWVALNSTGLGVGTTLPESKLHVSGGPITLKGGSSTDQQIVYNYAREYVNGIYNSSGHFRLQDNSLGGTVYQWDGSTFAFPNGNVGIGTTSPAYKLDISGNSRTTGIHYVDTYLVTPYIYGGGPITMGNNVFINSTEDGKLTLRVPSGDSSEWNYINFTGSNGVRDAYLGTDGGGTPTWYRDDNGVNITLSSSVLINGNTAWHAGNDGSGSGLDADLLDGIDSGSFLRSDVSDSFSGTLTMATQRALVPSNYGHGVYGIYSAERYQHVWSMGAGYDLPADGASNGNGGSLYGLAWSYNPDYSYVGSNAQAKPGLNHQLLLMMNGITYTALGNGIWTSGTITTVSHGTSSQWNTAYGWGNHASAGYATTSYVTTQINNLIAGAPGVLDTLDELAAALGDDANFATTVTNSIAGKMALYNGASGADLNTLLTNGVWRTHGGANGPMGTAHTTMISAFQSDGYYGWQLSSNSSDSLFFRFKDANFGSWVQLATRSWVTSQNYVTTSGYNNSNWDTAYSWGNHASAGYALNSALANYLPLSGGSIGGALTVNGNLTVNGTITENSSIKLKENVKTSEGNLEKVVNLRPVTYNKIGSQTTELGLIAEEVAEVYPEFVQYDENGDPIGVHYSRLTAALIGAVKELTNQVQELNKKING
jgi:hypothetical protein